MTSILEDAAQALRTLRRRPGGPLLGAIGLSVGLGVTVTVFSLLDATLLRPLPGANPRNLVAIHGFNKKDGSFADVSYPDFKYLAEDKQALDGVLAYFRAPLTIAIGEKSRRVSCELASSSYFKVLGLPPSAGRTFLDKEGEPPDRSAVVVMSDGLARREYGEPQAALGKTLRISGRTFQIVGVAPRNFQGISIDRAAPPEVWVPLWATGGLIAPFAGVLDRRDARFLRVVGRLKPGQESAEATRAVRQRAEDLEQEHPETNKQMTLRVSQGAEARVSPQLRKRIVSFAGIVTGVVALLVLVVSSNVGQLLLLNAWRRSTELALREALGAEPKRIVRQLAIESAMIATAGFLGALATAAALLQVLRQTALPFGLPQGIDVQLDQRMVLLTLAIAIATNLVFGLGAAVIAGRINWREALHSGRGTSKPAAMGSRLGQPLLGGQVALSLILLVGGTIFQRTVLESLSIDPGFKPEGVTLLSVDLNSVPGRYDETTGTSYFTSFTNRIQTIPGVKAAAWSGSPPLGARRLLAWWREASGDPWIQTDVDILGPGYFKTVGIGIKKGRDFQPSDDQKEDGKAIISESMAKHWKGTDPIGKKILVRGRKREVYEIVGIALDVRRRSLWEEPGPFLYLPLLQRYFFEMTANVKADRVQELAEILKSQDPDVPVELRRMEDVVKGAVSDQRFAATLLGASGAIGALIAVLGLYAATAYVVTQRTHELAIRSVLGATRRQVIRSILTECGLPVAAGLAAGIGMSIWLSRFVTGFVHGVSALDPVSFVVASSALAATCFVAVYVPASKATRLDPLVVLRAE